MHSFHETTYEPDPLQQQLSRLVYERQELRAAQAGRERLEANRHEIVRFQRMLSAALIAQHLDAAPNGAVSAVTAAPRRRRPRLGRLVSIPS